MCIMMVIVDLVCEKSININISVAGGAGDWT